MDAKFLEEARKMEETMYKMAELWPDEVDFSPFHKCFQELSWEVSDWVGEMEELEGWE